MISQKTIDEVIRRLVRAAEPDKVFLFGSYARGDAREGSDLDVLVVERRLASRRRETVRLHDVIRPLRIHTDIVVLSRAAFDQWSDIPGTLANKAKTEGRLCYDAARLRGETASEG